MLGLLLTSCRKDTIYTYIYENRSGYNIQIEDYSWAVKYIDIPNGEDYIYIYTIYGSGAKPAGHEPFLYSEKVRIIFNNERVLTYYRNNRDGIYPGSGDYRFVDKGRHNLEFYYTFTPEMYEEAVPIGEAEE